MNTTQNFPSRKTFIKKFFTEKWKFLFELKYQQATLWEYYEFFEKSDKERELELIELILSQIPQKIWEKPLAKIFPHYLPKIARHLDFEELCTEILQNKFRMHESIFTEVHEKKQKNNAGSNKEVVWIPSAIISLVCEKYNISILDVINNLTLEQFLWLQDGVTFLLNAQTEEWQKENSYAMRGNKKSSTNWEEVRKQFKNAGL